MIIQNEIQTKLLHFYNPLPNFIYYIFPANFEYLGT